MYKWCEEQDRRRFRITPAPHSYLRLYLKSSSAAVVVPFDTAGSDIYKLLYMMSKGPSSKIKKQTDYFEAVRQISDSLSDEEKNQIDAQGQGLPRQDHFSIRPFRLSRWSPVEGRSMVIISHPLSRLVNSWHHKFHKLGIEHEQGLKLIRFVF